MDEPSRMMQAGGAVQAAMQKTLLITEVFPPQHGGSGRWLWEIYRRFPEGQVTVLAGEHPEAAQFDQLQPLRIHRAPLCMPQWGMCSLQGVRDYLGLAARAARIAKAAGCDQIHCARLLPEGWIARLVKLRLGIPYICYAHGEELHCGVASRELGWMMRRVLAGAERMIVNTRNTEELLTDRWGSLVREVAVVNPGVDASQFTPASPDSAVRRRLGWDARPVVLTVGRLQQRKGQDMMIRALPAIREHVPDVLYAIVGGGEQREHLGQLTTQLGLHDQVQFLGELKDEDMIAAYQQCDLFALPNREIHGDIEGFGMVLVEAQACGKPVIAGDSGGTRETMQVGQTGLIVDCTRPEPLAEAVVQLLQDERRRRHMGQAARLWVEQFMDWSALAAEAYTALGGAPMQIQLPVSNEV